MSTVLAIWNTANKGKTETLRELARLLVLTYPHYTGIFPNPFAVPLTGDFRVVLRINRKVVAVESRGDPGTDLEGRLLELAGTFNADLIFCSTRTSGSTVDAVVNLRLNRGFDTIWTSTYETGVNHQVVNRLKAKHILDLVQTLGLI